MNQNQLTEKNINWYIYKEFQFLYYKKFINPKNGFTFV